ncbi:MAG TPA: ABC-F family ATP-binding cassette domain-containing protein [Herpetosiphonaceae bacterium]
MHLITGRQLGMVYGSQHVFANLSFVIAAGDKIGLVGPNGAGKSTLLRLILGAETPTSGAIARRPFRMAALAQEVRFAAGATLRSEAALAQSELGAMEAEMTRLEPLLADYAAPEWQERMARYGELQERFERGGGYERERLVERVFEGLGFGPAQWDAPLDQFSGGQKTRAALAVALLSEPDLLVLDEPTNHLDLAALEWLEDFLESWRGTLLVVSHDRHFLDRVTESTWELEWGGLETYAAAYSRAQALKAERQERQRIVYARQQQFIAKTEEYIRRYKNGSRARQAAGREKRLERFVNGWDTIHGFVKETVDPPRERQKLRFSLDTALRSGEIALSIPELLVGYGDEPLLALGGLAVRRGERVAVLGPNGSGKSSLLRTLVGAQAPLAGGWQLGANVRVGYYAQGHESLRPGATVLEEVARVNPAIGQSAARGLLGRFLFSRDDVDKRIGQLSGGERSRVVLAQLMLAGGNLLVLDEPTNHLDMAAREALEEVLAEFNGTLLFVSHDRYFVSKLADALWVIEDGALERVEAGAPLAGAGAAR